MERRAQNRPVGMNKVKEQQRYVAMIEIFRQEVPNPLAPPNRNLRAGLAMVVVAPLVVALFLGLTVWAKFGMGAQSTVAASKRVLAAAPGREQGGAAKSAPPQEEHGLSPKAEEITRIFGFPITNSMIVSWVVALGVIIFAQAATWNMKQIPDGAQNLLEWLVEGLHKFLEGVIGEHLTKRTFWFFATVFIFILCTNWVGLIPGIGSVGWGHQTSHGFQVEQAWLRGANADVNMTFAMALVFFACWIVWALQEVGPLGFLKELFAPKGQTTGLLRLLMVFVFFAAGCLEIVSILFRPISLSFRLYGNIYAGENMMEAMSRLVPGFGWLVPIPFYFLELLMGLVQALVFMLLTAVFTLLICQQEEGPVPAHG
jgi:F-type H+-transporting ATPase subunit a